MEFLGRCREFITLLGGGIDDAPIWDHLRQELREAGYVEPLAARAQRLAKIGRVGINSFDHRGHHSAGF